MKKKLRIAYWAVILVLLLSTSIFYAINKLNQKTVSKGSCSEVLSNECQAYLNKITKEGKFDEAIAIQERRIKDNIDILELNNKNISNKKWLKMDYTQIEKEFNEQSAAFKKENPERKLDENGVPVFEQFEKDFDTMSVNNFIVRDIVLDALIISTIQRKELKEYSKAKETLLSSKKVLEKAPYFIQQEDFLGLLDRNIAKAESAGK